jgi:hypothetical protein
MELKDCINNLTHSLLQQGDDMRQRTCGAPPRASALTLIGLYHQEVAFKRWKREYTLKVHQSMSMLARGTGDKNGSGSE